MALIRRKGGILKRGTLRPKKRATGLLGGKKTKFRAHRAKTKSDIYREWLVPEYVVKTGRTRYANPLRSIYWYWLSRDVRKSEWEKWDGKCLTCLVPLATWEEGQCGHVVASSVCGEFLRFDRRNLTIQHGKCNNPRFRPDAPALNAIHYDQRHGQGAWQQLYDMRKTEAKEPNQQRYRDLIEALPSYQEAKNAAQITT